jgi:hypothetical protein
MASPQDVGRETPDDPTMTEIMAAIELIYAGERDLARTRLERTWALLGRDPDPFHVCVLSHFMADVQDDVRQELAWDLRALSAAEHLSDFRVQKLHRSLTISGFLPSLHLNVADASFRLGDIEPAKKHLGICLDLVAGLSESPYNSMIRGGIEDLALRLERMLILPNSG